MKVSFGVPIKTVSGLNAREHFIARSKRVAKERKATHLCCPPLAVPKVFRVRLVRVSRGVVDDDAVPAALKGVRDAVAFKLGVDDCPWGPVEWSYAQEKGEPGVRVEIEGP